MKKIVCIGDSITYGYGVKKSERWSLLLENKLHVEVLNKGICGDTTTGVLSRIYRDVILNKATEVIIIIGINDFIWGVTQEQVRSNIATILFHMMHYNVKSTIAIPTPIYSFLAEKKWKAVAACGGSCINNNLKILGVWIKKFSEDYNIKIVDLNSIFYKEEGKVNPIYYMDGLHLNKIGHKKIAEELAKVL